MKKIFLSSVLLCLAMIAMAQPQGFGGFQMPQNNATFKDVNYAGDDLEAHCLDIYLPETGQDKYKVIVAIYGSAWFSNNMKVITFMSVGKPLVDAGFAADGVVVETDLDKLVEKMTEHGGSVYVVPNYTSMLDIHSKLAALCGSNQFWEN